MRFMFSNYHIFLGGQAGEGRRPTRTWVATRRNDHFSRHRPFAAHAIFVLLAGSDVVSIVFKSSLPEA
jgi:hypothetical protein